MHVKTILTELTRLLGGLEKQIDKGSHFPEDMEEISHKRSALQDFLSWIQRQ